MRAKTTFGESGNIAEKVAHGDVEIVFHNMTEIIPVQGVTILGPLPAELQKPAHVAALFTPWAASSPPAAAPGPPAPTG